MLAAMNDRSFVVTIAYTKTEVIQVAVFGLLFLGDPLTVPIVVAILIATAGRVSMSFKGGAPVQGGLKPDAAWARLRRHAGVLGGRLSRRDPVARTADFVLAATFTLAIGLLLQAASLSLYLALRDRAVLVAIAAMAAVDVCRASWGRLRRKTGFWPLRRDQRRQRAHAWPRPRCCSRRRSRS